ncbi:MAG: hypothetical protein ACRCX2_10310 [Paraclostridium sp.]
MDDILKLEKLKKLNELQFELELRKDRLDFKKKWSKDKLRMHKFIVITSVITLLALCISTTWFMELNGFNAFSISLLVVTGYTQLKQWITDNLDFKIEISKLEVDIEFLECQLKMIKEELKIEE